MNKEKKYLPYLALIFVNIIFGFSFVFTKTALDIYEPMQLIGYRFFMAVLFMSFLILIKVVKVNYRGKKIRQLIVLSVAQPILYFIFETLGLERTDSSMAGVVLALLPVFVVTMAFIFLNERLNKKQFFCSAISMAGVFYILFANNITYNQGQTLGIFFLFLAMLCAAAFNILSRKASTHFTPVEATYAMMWCGAIFFNALALFQFEYRGRTMDYITGFFQPGGMTAILYLGILSSVVAFLFTNYALSKIPASRNAVFANIITVVSIFAGVIFRGEQFGSRQILGTVIILLGVYGTNYFVSEKQQG